MAYKDRDYDKDTYALLLIASEGRLTEFIKNMDWDRLDCNGFDKSDIIMSSIDSCKWWNKWCELSIELEDLGYPVKEEKYVRYVYDSNISYIREGLGVYINANTSKSEYTPYKITITIGD